MYQYYPDEAYLAEKIYPMMREAALFYSDPEVLVLDPVSNRMVMSPTYSSEHGPMWGGDTFQQQLLWQLFTDVIEASEIVGEDGEAGGLRERLADLLPKLNPVIIGPTSGANNQPGVKEWYWETGYGTYAGGTIPGMESAHRHLSHLVGLFPGNLITNENSEWMTAAINSLTRRGDDATGWSRGMKTNLWARTGDGNHAYKIYEGLLKSATLNNLWDYHTGPNRFQIDGNFGGAAGIVEMLMQSHAGYIEPLPALPDTWPSGTVTGLTMRGGFTVDMTWENKEVTALDILSTAGQDCTVKLDNAAFIRVKEKESGADIATVVNTDNNTVSFETEEGATYEIYIDKTADYFVLDIEIEDNTATVNASLTAGENTSKEDAKLILAFYDADGRLLTMATESIDIPAATMTEKTLSAALPQGTATVKAFLWDAAFTPLISAETATIY
jgi:hypothetical protein